MCGNRKSGVLNGATNNDPLAPRGVRESCPGVTMYPGVSFIVSLQAAAAAAAVECYGSILRAELF